MAMRRSRIQIKPNTGPRPTGKTSSSDNTPLSPVKTTAQSPCKVQVQNSPVKPLPASPTKPLPASPTKQLPASPTKPLPQVSATTVTETVTTTKSTSTPLTNRSLNKQNEIIVVDDKEITSTPVENSTSQSISDQKEDSSSGTKNKEKVNEPEQNSKVKVDPPKQRTRLKKPPPKIPGHRQPPKQVEKNNVPKEPETTIIAEVEPRLPEEIHSEEDSVALDSTSETSDAQLFKKPEVPVIRKPPVKETLPATENAVHSVIPDAVVTKSAISGRSKSKSSEVTRHARKNRTQFNQTEPPDRTKMTIMDLIHWNPIQNPMSKAVETSKVVEPQSLEVESTRETENNTEASKDKENEDYVPGPRVIVGEDGQITLDESSLVIEQTAPEKDLSQEVVYETSDTTYSSYSKKVISRQLWSMKDTAMFYKALSVVGTDFALMSKFFPKRTRTDLKRKFKKEERTRRDLLDKAVSEWHNFDLQDIQDFIFCKELETVNDQDEEEARVDNPDGVEKEIAHPNNYVRENLLNIGPKRRGRPPGQKNKKKDGKTNGTQKEKKNKRPAPRNAWSDEEAEPVEDEDITEVNEDESHQCEEHHEDDDSCDCCLLKTKTSKRQKTLEAKKRTLQALEEEKARHLISTLGPVRDAPRCPSPEIRHDSIPFTVITNQTGDRFASPLPAQLSSASLYSPSSNNSSPDATLNNSMGIRSPSPFTMQSISLDHNRLRSPSPVAHSSTSLRSPNSATNLTRGVTLSTNIGIRSPPHLSTQSTSSGQGRDTSVPKQVNILNINNSVAASPLLQALLNKAPGITGGAPGQILLVADKTPNNEQVLHVYLVSPNNTPDASQTPSEMSPSGNQVNADTLRRLGIRPIGQEQSKQSDPSNQP